MRTFFLVLAIVTASMAFPNRSAADETDVAQLEVRAAELQQKINQLQEELDALREQIAALSPRRSLTPPQALEAFERNPDRRVTVEFGVERIGSLNGPIAEGEDPEPPIIATWDNFFHGGGTLTAIVPPGVFRQLTLPTPDGPVKLTPGMERAQVVGHIETNGIRVTGLLERVESFTDNDYVIRVQDPADVELYVKK